MIKLAAAVITCVLLVGCKDVAEKCVDVVRMNYRDPESLRVIDKKIESYGSVAVTITATNGYGARVQSKIFCKYSHDGKFSIDESSTSLHELEKRAEELRRKADEAERINNRRMGIY